VGDKRRGRIGGWICRAVCCAVLCCDVLCCVSSPQQLLLPGGSARTRYVSAAEEGDFPEGAADTAADVQHLFGRKREQPRFSDSWHDRPKLATLLNHHTSLRVHSSCSASWLDRTGATHAHTQHPGRRFHRNPLQHLTAIRAHHPHPHRHPHPTRRARTLLPGLSPSRSAR